MFRAFVPVWGDYTVAPSTSKFWTARKENKSTYGLEPQVRQMPKAQVCTAEPQTAAAEGADRLAGGGSLSSEAGRGVLTVWRAARAARRDGPGRRRAWRPDTRGRCVSGLRRAGTPHSRTPTTRRSSGSPRPWGLPGPGEDAPRSWVGRGRLTRGSAGAAAQLQVSAAAGGPGCRPSRRRESIAFVSLGGALFATAAAASVLYGHGCLFRAQLPPLLLKLLLLLRADQRLHGEGVRLKA